MAARINRGTKDKPWAENVRQRIKASMLANRLQDHALGNVEMSASQVRAAEVLLDRVAPKLSATELSGAVERTTVIRAPETVANSKTWLEKHGPVRVDPEPKPDQVN